MSTLFNNNLGFYKTPITKTLLGSVVLTSSALNVPILSNYRQLMVCNINDILFRYKFWRLFVSKIAFFDIKDIICGTLLLYYFRVFERRYGSHKYSSYLLACFTVSALLEVCLVSALNGLNITNIEHLMSGPFNVIFALFVNYYFDIPALNWTHLMALPITVKTLPYLLGAQTMFSSNSSIVCAISGVISGLICRSNVLNVCDFIKIPESIASVVSKVFGRLLSSSPPPDPPIQMGATFEIQRQQHMELVEQQMLFTRFREINQNNDLNAFPNRRQNNLYAQTTSASMRPDPGAPAPGSSTNSDNVTALVEMGFERQNVVRALQRSNNDMNLATNLLLSET